MTLPAVDFRKQHHQHAKSSKMQPHKAGQTNSKRLKFHSASCASSKAEDVFPKLDPSIPEQARRMEQRRRMISYGKNTVGYEEYLRQVPKEKRNRRSMETPTTPDHTLDIPNKRWQGQIKAWRKALHQYDPADLQKSFAAASQEAFSEANNATVTPNKTEQQSQSVQDMELEQAKSTGLLVDISPTSVAHACDDMNELDQWDKTRGQDEFLCSDDDDSDDDLL